MAIAIQEFRYSFVWAETVIEHLSYGSRLEGEYAFLSHDNRYQAKFEEVLAGGGSDELAPAWPYPVGQKFWYHYLEGRPLDAVRGKEAWRLLVPFRRKLRSVKADWLNGKLTHEAFIFPHGLAYVATVRCSLDSTIDKALAQALEVVKRRYDVQQEGDKQKKSLNRLAADTLNDLRAEIFGDARGAGARTDADDPFSVFTVLRASGVDATVPADKDDSLQRALHTVVRRKAIGPGGVVWDIKDHTLPADKQKTYPNQVLYAAKRGRAVWFPQWLVDGTPKNSTLSCYHRNLTLCGLQVESLGNLVTHLSDHLDDELPSLVENCGRYAAGILGRMHGGSPKAYRSWSAGAHIQDCFLDAANSMRDEFEMPALERRQLTT